VSGVDAVRGINYQHCHALLAALDVAANPNLAGIRVEGTDDVLDLEVHAVSPGAGAGVGTVVVRGMQMKSRLQPYTWAKAELLAIVRRWAGCPVSATSEFALLTDGELGPSGRLVADALDAARDGDLGPIAAFLGLGAADPLCALAAKATIVSEPGTVEALLLAAEREVRARLPYGPTHPDAAGEAEERVNALFRLVSTRSGLPNRDDRMISRDELLEVLGGLSQLPAADRWADDLGEEYLRVAAAEEVAATVHPALHAGWNNKRLALEELTGVSGPILLTGRTGSGKSTVAKLWRVSAAADRERVVVCHAEGYVPQRLDRAIADAVGDAVGRDLPRIVGRQVLGDPGTTVVVDGVSEIPPQFRRELAKELRYHLARGHGARIALLGRDESVCASTLTATQTSNRLYPQAFGHEERLAMTAKLLTESRAAQAEQARDSDESGSAGAPGESFEHDCRVALAQVEHALGDAAGNPMLLRLALELVVGGTAFTDRASLYELTIDRMAARTNVADIRLASAALGIVFARLLDEGRRYASPLEWARLFNEASATLEALGLVTATNEVREAIERSGLVNAVVTGIGQTRLRVPVHDSFADYFAARAHADDLVSLPETLVENDENRVLLSAQMSMLSDAECLAVAAQLPFTLVRLSESDQGPIDDRAPGLVAALLDAVLPDADPMHVTMWRDFDRAIAQAGTRDTGWVAQADGPALFDNLTTVSEPTDGPIVTAVRLWRLILNQRLTRKAQLRPRSPQSRSEGRDQLAAHCRATITANERIISEVAPPAAAQRLSQTVGPQGMTGVVYQRQEGKWWPDGWPVRYRRTPPTDLTPAANDERPDLQATGDYSHSGDVESLVTTSPEQTAAKQVTEAINKLTRPHWL